MGRSRRWLAGALAVGIVGSGATALTVAGSGIAAASELGPGDGLHRFVVRTTAEGAPASLPPAADVVLLPAVDPVLLAAGRADLGTGGTVRRVGEFSYYVTGDSSRRVSHPGAPLVPPAAVAAAVPADDVLAALQAVPGVRTAQRLSDGGVLVATSGSARDLDRVPGVAAVEESPQVSLFTADPTDPYYSRFGWNLQNTGRNAGTSAAVVGADVDAPEGWETTEGQGAVVAVVDSGYASLHPDLQGAWWTNPTEDCGTVDTNRNGKAGDCHGWNFYAGTAAVDNGSYGAHGAAVAGVVGARRDNGQGSAGVAPRVSIMPLVVGGGSTIDINLAAEAIRYAADNGADVVNASFGGAGSEAAFANFRAAVRYAASKGVLVVAAAGNDSGNRDTSIVYPASLDDDNVITVGSTTSTDAIAGHSGYGARNVDLFAPGENVFSITNTGGYSLWSGTSFAAPHVAAAVALYRSARPDATASEIKAAVLADSTKLANLTGRSVSGGRLDVSQVAPPENRGVAYAFSGAGTVTTPTQHPVVHVSGGAAAGEYSVRLGVVAQVDGDVWGAAGVPVSVAGTTYTTDDLGEVVVGLGRQEFLRSGDVGVDLALPLGSYALTAQLLLDGEPLTRPYAAPLTVADPSAPVPTSQPTTAPTSSPAAPVRPPTSGPATSPGVVLPTPSTTRPGVESSSPGSTTVPRTTAPPAPVPTGAIPTPQPPRNPTAVAPTASATPAPAIPTRGTSVPGTPATPVTPAPGGPAPVTAAPVTPTPVTPAPTTQAPVPTASAVPTSGPSRAPGSGTATYPGTGRFSVTAVAPATVSSAGGDRVTVTGRDLDAVRAVLVGASGPARIVAATGTSLVVVVPARVPGRYDLTLFGVDGSQQLLAGALTVTAPAGTNPVPSSSATSPSTPPAATTAPATTPAPIPTPRATSTPTPPPPTTPAAPAPGPAAGEGPAVRSGPGGVRLVRRTDGALFEGVWPISGCEQGCSGRQV